MKSFKLLSILTVVVMLVGMLSFPAAGRPVAAAGPDGMDKVEALVLEQLAEKGQTDFFLWMTEKADLSGASQLNTKAEKGQFVYDALRTTAQRTQKDLRAYLDAQGADYRSFYVVNRIWVKGGNEALLRDVAARPDVAKITANHPFKLDEPVEKKPAGPSPNYVEPNISFLKADQAWAMGYTGQGMVVADDDTGIDHTHPTILPHYRGCLNPPTCDQIDHDYAWFDAFGDSPDVPWDDYGHGTHTTGTMVGDDGVGNQIGMAPGAQAIACKNMQGGGGDDAHFLICFEWNLAPTRTDGTEPRPDLAPDSVNNSWGYWGGGNDVFRDVINSLQAAGIVVEVSAGNEGSGCSSLRSPGDYEEVFTTGSVNHAYAYPGLLTGFSSRGPSILDGDYFPDFMAPGENVRSALPGNQYGYWGGTSMAGPHVTALIALIWSANPALRGQVDTTHDIIRQTVTPLTGQGGSNCGGDYTTGPNNDWGYGTVDALAAVQLAISYGGAGIIQGTVTDETNGSPVNNATVQAVRQEGGTWTAHTAADGTYTITVAAGTFDVTASHPQYMAETEYGVVVDQDETEIVDFALEPRGWLYGYVTDADNGTPIEGAGVADDFGNLATTNAAGYYELWLDPGTWNVTVVAQNYAPQAAMVTIVSGQGTQQDWALEAAVTFVPSPIEVSVPLGSTHTEPATIINRQPWDYAFEFTEKDGGYVPLRKGFLPAFTGEVEHTPASLGRAPNAPQLSGNAAAEAISALAGSPAYAVDVYPGYNLVNFTADNPGGWTVVAPLPGNQYFGGDFINGDFSTLYVVDYGYNSLYAVDTATGAVTLIGPSVPGGGEAWTGLTGASDGTMYGVGSTCGSSTLYTVDLATGALTTVGPITNGPCVIDIAATPDGDIYAVEIVNDVLLKIDPATGAGTVVGSLGVGANYAQGMDYDEETGTLYWAAYTGQGELRIIDPATGNSTLVGAFPGGAETDSLAFATGGLTDVLWLAEDPVSGVVPAESSLGVDILFDASPAAGVTQPGTYLAQLTVKGDPKVKVPVTMQVEAPASWGRIEGTVTGLGYCDANPAPAEGATVVITGSSGASWTMLTDAAGHWAIWLDSAENPLTIDVTAPEHLGQSVTADIIPGGNVVVDFDLRWDEPCLSLDPLSLSATLDLGQTDTQQVTLTNNGAGEGTFENSDLEKGYVPLRKGFLPAFTGEVEHAPASLGRAPNAPQLSAKAAAEAISALAGSPAYAVDVYPGYNLVNFTADNPGGWTVVAGLPGNQYFGGDFINGDFSTLYVVDYATNSLYTVDTATGAVTLIGPSAPPGESWTGLTGAVDGTMYGVGSTCGSSTLYTVDLTSGALTAVGPITNGPCVIDIAATPDGKLYAVEIVGDVLLEIDPATGAGTVIGSLGVGANYAQGMDFDEETGTLYWAAYTSAGELRIIDPATGNSTLVGAFPGGAEVDSLAFATGGGGDAPWLTEDPVSGTVPPDGGQQVIDVTFDAGQVALPGTYTGQVIVKTDDPVNAKFTVDATLVVNAPPDWGKLEGTVTGLGYCDGESYPIKGAQVAISGGITVETDANGHYILWMAAGTYDVTVTADGHSIGTATVVVNPGGQTTVQDFALRWLQPCMSEEPPSLEVTLDLGQTDTQQVTLTNDGAAEGTFEVKDSDKGYVPLSKPKPAGQPVTPNGASSDAKIQLFESRLNANPILLVSATDTSQSVEKALQELGYGYDYMSGPPWTGIDFSPYETVIIAMDGGLAEVADVQKLRTDVLDEGKKLIFLGGTCYQPFAQGMNDYIVLNDVNNYCWQVTGYPQWTITDPAHPLADGLPDSYNYVNSSAGYYQIRVNDPDVETVGINGENWPAFFRKSTDGAFIWYIDSVYSYYWTDPSDFAFLKQLISNSIEVSGGGDALWLTEHPVSGTVAPDGGQQVIDVTFDAGMVTQPGTYLAEVIIKTNDPVNKKFVVPATMHVNGPPDWGRVEGIVQSLGYCDQNPAPAKGAIVTVDGGLQLVTDANGHYSSWLPSGDHELVVTADGHVGASATVTVVPQQTTYQDFGLRSMQPCISVTPLAFDVTVPVGSSLTEDLTLVNAGAGDSTFKIREQPVVGGLEAVDVSVKAGPSSAPDKTAVAAGEYKARPAGKVSVVQRGGIDQPNVLLLAADDDAGGGSPIRDMLVAYGDLGNIDLYDARYGTPTLDELLAYEVVVVWANYTFSDPNGIGNVLADYVDAGGKVVDLNFALDPNWGYQGRFRSEGYSAMTIAYTSYNNSCLGTFDPSHPIMDGVTDVCDLYRGASTVLNPNSYEVARWQDNELFVAAKDDQSVATINAYVGVYYQWTGQMADVLHNAILWLAVPSDVPWLSEDPIEGTVAADSSFSVAVTFDSAGLAVGDYMANLVVRTDDAVNAKITVPVTMHVVSGGASMHIGDIQGQFSLDPYGRSLIKIRVLVHDQDHSPLGEAAVDASLWSPAGGPYERTRMTKNMTGKAAFPWGSKSAGMWKICVDHLTKPGYGYVPGDNDVPACAEWDNTP